MAASHNQTTYLSGAECGGGGKKQGEWRLGHGVQVFMYAMAGKSSDSGMIEDEWSVSALSAMHARFGKRAGGHPWSLSSALSCQRARAAHPRAHPDYMRWILLLLIFILFSVMPVGYNLVLWYSLYSTRPDS